jgi:hypothetical protein
MQPEPTRERRRGDCLEDSAQKTVAIGAACGIATMVLLLAGLSAVIPQPAGELSVADRLAFALRWNLLAIVPLLLMLTRVADGRFRSDAIDPLARRETRAQLIDARVTSNTLEQYVLFLVGSLSLSTLLPAKYLPTLPAACVVFVLARLAFWIGYHKDPLYRAPGMAATSILNFGILGTALVTAMLR